MTNQKQSPVAISDTPRTDSQKTVGWRSQYVDIVPATLSKQLERELNAAIYELTTCRLIIDQLKAEIARINGMPPQTLQDDRGCVCLCGEGQDSGDRNKAAYKRKESL